MTFCVDKYRRCRNPIVSTITLTVLFGKSEAKDSVGNAGEVKKGCVKMDLTKRQYDNGYQVYSLLYCDATYEVGS
jgi:hypothetical protein